MKTDNHNVDSAPMLNKSVFEALFKAHYGSLCKFAWGYVNDVDAAEEVVQEVYVKLWEKREELGEIASFKAYLYRAVTNHCLNISKHQKVVSLHAQEVLSTESELENTSNPLEVTELEEHIQKAISLLPEERRKVFVLSRTEGLKYQEIADKLAISVKTVENQMGKALQFLREQLKQHWVTVFISLIINKIINFL